jgi:hypothetical protein
VQICYTKFHPDRAVNVGSTERNLFGPFFAPVFIKRVISRGNSMYIYRISSKSDAKRRKIRQNYIYAFVYGMTVTVPIFTMDTRRICCVNNSCTEFHENPRYNLVPDSTSRMDRRCRHIGLFLPREERLALRREHVT